jgi:hypothetical protein
LEIYFGKFSIPYSNYAQLNNSNIFFVFFLEIFFAVFFGNVFWKFFLENYFGKLFWKIILENYFANLLRKSPPLATLTEITKKIKNIKKYIFRYMDALSTNSQRRKACMEKWGFTCKCQRCEDETEFGTFASGVICCQCDNGTLLVNNTPRLPGAFPALFRRLPNACPALAGAYPALVLNLPCACPALAWCMPGACQVLAWGLSALLLPGACLALAWRLLGACLALARCLPCACPALALHLPSA